MTTRSAGDARLKLVNLRVDLNARIGVFTFTEISKRILRSGGGGRLVATSLTGRHAWLLHKSSREALELRTIATTPATTNSSDRQTHVINVSSARQMRRRVRRCPHRAAANDDEDGETHTDGEDTDEDIDDDEEEDDEDDEMMRIMCDMDGAALLDGDVKETYLRLIFEPYRFSHSAIHKSMGILSQYNASGHASVAAMTRDQLKQQLIRAIEREVQSEPTFATCTEEDFFYLNSKCWSKYYSMLKQYDFDARTPLGLLVQPHDESHVVLIRKVYGHV